MAMPKISKSGTSNEPKQQQTGDIDSNTVKSEGKDLNPQI